MELTCDDCRAIIQIADERVPPNSTFRLTCPRCKRRIVVSTKPPENLTGGKITDSPAVRIDEESPSTGDNLREACVEETDTLQFGQSAALLCLDCDYRFEVLKSVLQGMGYMVDTAATVDQALNRLRFNQYQIIVLTEQFGGSSSNPVAGYLARLNMNVRRDMFVVLVGEQFKTADHMQAFIESVNLVLHSGDLSQIETFLSRGLGENERFYKVFTECLIEAGKKI
jgi:predicted Zn finger-like uncharacterized protein